MPQVVVNITQVNKLPGTNRVVEIEAVQGDNSIIRTINLDDFSTWTDFASWLINQTPDRTSQPDWLRSLTIDFHTETTTDPETGLETTTRIVDNVVVNPL